MSDRDSIDMGDGTFRPGLVPDETQCVCTCGPYDSQAPWHLDTCAMTDTEDTTDPATEQFTEDGRSKPNGFVGNDYIQEIYDEAARMPTCTLRVMDSNGHLHIERGVAGTPIHVLARFHELVRSSGGYQQMQYMGEGAERTLRSALHVPTDHIVSVGVVIEVDGSTPASKEY